MINKKILPIAGNFNEINKIGLNLTIRNFIQNVATRRFRLRRCISHVLLGKRAFFSFTDQVYFETFPDVLLIPFTLEHKLGMNIDHNVMHLKEMH